MNKDLLVVGIEGVMRTHPIPKLDNFVVVPWEDKHTIERADVFMQANIKEAKLKQLRPQYQYIQDSGKPYLVTESAVFRQNLNPDRLYHRWAWWSYFWDEADYNCENSPPDRWNQIKRDQNITVKDWRLNEDGYVLVLLQRPRDSSLRNLVAKHGRYDKFIYNTIQEIRRYTDREIRFRLHPLKQEQQLEAIRMAAGTFKDITISANNDSLTLEHGGSGGPSLQKDLDGARVCVGFNSNALTETVIEGIPTFSLDPSSMAWTVSNHFLRNIENPQVDIPREQWLYNLGYCQWREDEIELGLPWYHLKERLNA